jgi:hypothetical protein
MSSVRAPRPPPGFASRSGRRPVGRLPPAQLRLAERVARRLGVRGQGDGRRDALLCHTVCEFGATRLLDALAVYREFLDEHRGEVAILFVEPYVPPVEFANAAQRAGLDRYVATLDRDEPLSTLGEHVRSDRRVVVLAEEDADGSVPWYLDGFSFVQDTPLRATTPDQLSCRGTADTPTSSPTSTGSRGRAPRRHHAGWIKRTKQTL